MADEPPSTGSDGKLRIPLPFEDALRAATKVPADKLPKPNGKQPKRKPAKD